MAKVNWKTATPKQAQDMREFIGQNRKDVADLGITPHGGGAVEDSKDPLKDRKGRG